MRAEDILKKMGGLGFNIDRRTLNNYVKWELINPPAQRIGGRGVYADYPDYAMAEAATAFWLMHEYGWKKEKVREARSAVPSYVDVAEGWLVDTVLPPNFLPPVGEGEIEREKPKNAIDYHISAIYLNTFVSFYRRSRRIPPH